MPSCTGSQKQTSKASLDSTRQNENSIPPPPFGLAAAGSSKNSKHTATTGSESSVPAKHNIGSIFQNQNLSDDGVITPKPGCDIVALIFVLLSLPQSWSCLVLVCYILSGSFRSLAGKYISSFLLNIDGGIKLSLDAHLKKRNSYYRSELLGEFLQLFSVNSFILLVCHYTLPRAWFRYLVILAKSIIASRLVGTHTTGSTTYVSVVSNTANSTGTVTTTTTTSNGRYVAGSSKTETGSMYGSFANFVTGFSFVIAANYLKDKMSRSNTSVFLKGLLDFFGVVLPFVNSPYEQALESEPVLAVSIHHGPSFFDFLPWKKSSHLDEDTIFASHASWPGKVIFSFLIHHFGLTDRSIQRLSSVSKELLIIINFAYLVLCIHVISLTISPLFHRIFILRDYSKTLDHLSGLTPDVPYGGFKKGGLVSSAPRDLTNESTTVINLEQHRTQLSAATEPHEIKVNHEISKIPPGKPSSAFKASITAENFKVFCMKPPSSKLPIPVSKQGPGRTIVDRKRSNSTATPSTTIVDKYYTISIQPIWTWLAAIKILFTKPSLFSGSSSEDTSGYNFGFSPCTLVSIEDSKIIFEVTDQTRFHDSRANLSVRVNGVSWAFVESFSTQVGEGKNPKVFISVFGLSASRQYDIEFMENSSAIGRHIVTTTSGFAISCNCSTKDCATGLLQSSILYTMSILNDMKVNFKKTRKEESKRVTELKRQTDALKSKIDKYGVTETNEGRIDAKLRGLQNSVMQLENEIEDMEQQVRALTNGSGKLEAEFRAEELKLNHQIDELESYINEYEQNASKSRRDVKSVEDEKQAAAAKLKKHESKMKSRMEEIAKLNNEIKGMKKSLVARIQRRQRKVQDRIDTIIPKITEACEELNDQIKGFAYD